MRNGNANAQSFKKLTIGPVQILGDELPYCLCGRYPCFYYMGTKRDDLIHVVMNAR